MHRPSVLITGCSSGGIGFALAHSFHRHGYHVFATARSLSKMSPLDTLPNVTLLALDVTSSSSIAAAVKAVVKETSGGGGLNCLVNNAGCLYVMPALDTDLDVAKRMFDVNFWGALAMVQAFGGMLAMEEGGCVVNVSSVAGCVGMPWMSTYAASKAALSIASEIQHMEMSPLGVRVLTVNSGLIKSNLARNSPGFNLPPHSLYRSIGADVAKRARMEDVALSGTEADVYAGSVVSDVLAHKEGTVWRGAFAETLRWVKMVLPGFLLDMLMVRGSGLGELKVSKGLAGM